MENTVKNKRFIAEVSVRMDHIRLKTDAVPPVQAKCAALLPVMEGELQGSAKNGD